MAAAPRKAPAVKRGTPSVPAVGRRTGAGGTGGGKGSVPRAGKR